MNKVQLYRRFFFFCCLKKLLSCGRWGMCEKLGYDIAFCGIAVNPMKWKRFRENRKFHPCNFFAWYPKLSHVVFNTTSHNIQNHIIHFSKLFSKLFLYSPLHHITQYQIQSYIISNTITSSIKYYVKLFPFWFTS